MSRRRHTVAFAAVVAFTGVGVIVAGQQPPSQVTGVRVTITAEQQGPSGAEHHRSTAGRNMLTGTYQLESNRGDIRVRRRNRRPARCRSTSGKCVPAPHEPVECTGDDRD